MEYRREPSSNEIQTRLRILSADASVAEAASASSSSSSPAVLLELNWKCVVPAGSQLLVRSMKRGFLRRKNERTISAECTLLSTRHPCVCSTHPKVIGRAQSIASFSARSTSAAHDLALVSCAKTTNTVDVSSTARRIRNHTFNCT